MPAHRFKSPAAQDLMAALEDLRSTVSERYDKSLEDQECAVRLLGQVKTLKKELKMLRLKLAFNVRRNANIQDGIASLVDHVADVLAQDDRHVMTEADVRLFVEAEANPPTERAIAAAAAYAKRVDEAD